MRTLCFSRLFDAPEKVQGSVTKSKQQGLPTDSNQLALRFLRLQQLVPRWDGGSPRNFLVGETL
eukprot:88864-Prorocentrum_minimum.AAC.1